MPTNIVKYVDLGLVDYKQAWDFQTKLFEENISIKISNRETGANIPTNHYLIFCEHPHVYTIGKSGKKEHLLLHEKELEAINAKYYEINRGGDITYHGPGQLVVYPILDLDCFFTDIHKYMRLLEEIIISLCADFGLSAGRIEGLTGVWIGKGEQNQRKICAMGVKTSRWVTMHGLAFNINPDLKYFSHIIPCGIQDKAVTSMQKELNIDFEFDSVKNIFRGHFGEIFECKVVD